MNIGTLVLIGTTKHVIIDKFWVGFGYESNLQKEYYYETFSMGDEGSKRRTAITCTDFKAGMAEGKIRILSPARES